MSDHLDEIISNHDEYYEQEFEDRAAEFNLQDINESYLGLNNINLLLGGLNSNVVESLKQYKGPLKEHFNTVWASKIIDLYGEKGIDANTIRLALEDTDLSPQNVEIVAQHYEKTHDQLGEKSISYIKTRFQQILNAAKMNWFVNNVSDPEKIVEGISKKGVIKIGDGLDEFKGLIDERSLLDYDISQLKDLSTSGIKSSFDFVNKSFVCNGWPDGSLVLLTAPPGTGKTAFMLNEVLCFLQSGYHVVYCAIGDMGPSDFLIRMSAGFYNVKLNHVVENSEIYLTRFMHDFKSELKRLHTLFIDPGVVKTSQLKDYFQRKKYINTNTICIIDYDMNLKPEDSDSKSDSSFEQFRTIYNIAIAMTRGDERFKALFMLGQPKTESYDQVKSSLISAGSMGSCKLQICDIVASFTRDPQASNIMGYFSILKCRRHGRVCSTPYILNMSGKVSAIDISTYNVIRDGTEIITDKTENINHQRIVEETKKMMLNGFKEQKQIDF